MTAEVCSVAEIVYSSISFRIKIEEHSFAEAMQNITKLTAILTNMCKWFRTMCTLVGHAVKNILEKKSCHGQFLKVDQHVAIP